VKAWFSPFRVATYLLLVFCAGHTYGGMLSQKSLGPAADDVFKLMKTVHFDFNGSDVTWYGFWFAFGLMSSVFMLLSAAISWQLDRAESWESVAFIGWAMVISHAVHTYFAWRYFFVGPGVFATAITVLLAIGCWRRGAVAMPLTANRTS
jgi:hypothetical protein